METVFSIPGCNISKLHHKIIITATQLPDVDGCTRLMTAYQNVLESEPKNKHLKVYVDAHKIPLSQNILVIRELTNGFIGMRHVSESRIRCFAASISSQAVSNIINGVMTLNPGPIPTKISDNEADCKRFLSQF